MAATYRLAPEHPFPAGVDVSFTVYTELVRANPGSGIALIGDSAGAYLSLVTALKARDEHVRRPAAIVLNSVVADLSGTLQRQDSKREVTLTVGSLASLTRMYASGMDLTDPYISTILADFDGLPPMRVAYDRDELLSVDSRAVAEKASAAGVIVEVEEYHGTFHAFTTTGKNTPESKSELDHAARFMRDALRRAGTGATEEAKQAPPAGLAR